MDSGVNHWANSYGEEIATRTAHMRMTPRRLVQSCRPSLWKGAPFGQRNPVQIKEKQHSRHACKTRLDLEPRLPVVVSTVPGGHAISLDRFCDDMRDWRKLCPHDVIRYFHKFWKCSAPLVDEGCLAQQRKGLMASVCVGILQAVSEGSFWAPHFDHVEANKVDGVRVPMSRIYPKCAPLPTVSSKCASNIDNMPKLTVLSETSPLDACVELSKNNKNPHVALLRFTPVGDVSSTVPSLGMDFSEAELFLRTTYGSALQELSRHVHSDTVRCLDAGGVVYTTDVAILREPIESGAAWLGKPFRLDIIWMALPRRPQLDSFGDYGHQSERRCVAEVFQKAIHQASSQGVEALVLSPPGFGNSSDSCVHPPKLIGKFLRDAVISHGQSLQEVQLCRERGRRICNRDWEACVEAFQDADRPRVNCNAVFTAASLNLGEGWEQNGPLSRGWMRRIQACPPPKDWRKAQSQRLEMARARSCSNPHDSVT